MEYLQQGGLMWCIDAKENNQQCPRFTAQQQSDLEDTASNTDKSGYHQARAALGIEEDMYFIRPINFRSLMIGEKRQELKWINVQPNPTNGSAWFTYRQPEGSEKVEIEIFDPLGKLILWKDISSSKGLWEWDTHGMNNGLYLFKFKVDGIKLQSDKISVIR